jgi:hypothetical protein
MKKRNSLTHRRSANGEPAFLTATVAAIILGSTMTVSGALAQTPRGETNRDCAASPAPLPAELAAWPSHRKAEAAKDRKGYAQAALVIGQRVDAKLSSTPDVHYVVRPEKPGGSVSYGGLFTFSANKAGIYRVALGSAAWVDIVSGQHAVASTAHGHGPECSGILKMVDFPLRPGRYVLQISANGEPTLPLMVARIH